MLKKIWSDSVWSKVIASAIIGSLLIIYSKIESITKEITFTESLKKVLDLKISIVLVIGIILVFLIIKSIITKTFKSKNSYFNKKEKKLQQFNRSADPEMGLLYKWNVYFKQNGNPFIADLTGFCTNHGEAPIKLINGNCPLRDCDNNRINLDESLAANHIESLIINEWDLINK